MIGHQHLRLLSLSALVWSSLAQAAPFDFAPASQTDLNRVYRIDRQTGEVGACQYGLQDGKIGVTVCYPAGEGGGPQVSGEYGLVASHHEREAGVFRVNHRTGEISVCFVFEEKVVCAPSQATIPVAPTRAKP